MIGRQKYYLIFPLGQDIVTAKDFSIESNGLVKIQAINYLTFQLVNTQYFSLTMIQKIIEYPDSSSFRAATNKMIESAQPVPAPVEKPIKKKGKKK